MIEEFLPKAMDETGLKALVLEVIETYAAENGLKPGPKEMGSIIKAVQAQLQATGSRAEGRLVSEAVKAALSS